MNYIFCDGGLANRLNTLFVGLLLKETTGTPWSVAWPQNRWCGAHLNDLFVSPLPVVPHGLTFFKRFSRKFTFLFHENQIGFPEEKIFYHSKNANLEGLQNIILTNTPVVYFHNLMPSWFGNEQFRGMANKLVVKPEIKSKVDKFTKTHNISKKTIGIQIRKTDFGNKVNDNEIYNIVKTSQKSFFICSDSQEVEQRFAKLPNCFVNLKSHYAEKLNKNNDWNDFTTDDSGRTYPYNIKRSAESVCDALVDFLILSRTSITPVSGSTFQNLAIRYSTLY
jgi:hypothetical protein